MFFKFLFNIYFLIFFLIPNSLLKERKNLDNKIIAKVENNYLYKSDLKDILEGLDSTEKENFKKQFINNWINKHLIISQAKKLGIYNEVEVERKVLDYKYALIVHDFIEQSIKNEISYDISDDDIEKYYNENTGNFELKENIVKCRYAIIPKKVKNSNTIVNLFFSSKDSDREKLKSYCENNAKSYYLNPSTWLKFDDIIQNTPYENTRDKLRLLKKMKKKKINKLIGNDNIYYYEIIDFKISNNLSPIEFVKEKIKDIIIHKNKIELKNKFLKNILIKAKKNKNYEIF